MEYTVTSQSAICNTFSFHSPCFPDNWPQIHFSLICDIFRRYHDFFSDFTNVVLVSMRRPLRLNTASAFFVVLNAQTIQTIQSGRLRLITESKNIMKKSHEFMSAGYMSQYEARINSLLLKLELRIMCEKHALWKNIVLNPLPLDYYYFYISSSAN